jgi:proteasome accessory factor C
VYWTPGRNEESSRRITVRSVFTDKGHWYVSADDDASGSSRHFRVDRIRSTEKTGEFVAVRVDNVTIPTWFASADGKTVAVLEIEPRASWIVETYPCQKVEELDNGKMRVEIVVTSEHWLSRLLLRGGDAVKVISPETLVDVRRRVAQEMLALYDNKSSS